MIKEKEPQRYVHILKYEWLGADYLYVAAYSLRPLPINILGNIRDTSLENARKSTDSSKSWLNWICS